MEFSSNGAPLFGGFITYLQKNAWYIVIMLAAWFYVKTNRKSELETLDVK